MGFKKKYHLPNIRASIPRAYHNRQEVGMFGMKQCVRIKEIFFLSFWSLMYASVHMIVSGQNTNARHW